MNNNFIISKIHEKSKIINFRKKTNYKDNTLSSISNCVVNNKDSLLY